jgi:alkaline phosphatase D
MLDLSRISEAVRYEGGLSRRLFLAYGASLAALPPLARQTAAADRKVSFSANPFSLGVASGDPDATSVVLWTKLAPSPLEPDGGMKPEPVNVSWEIAEDEAMKTIAASGTAVASPKLGHSVHVEAKGLEPARWYYYRFTAGDAVSPIGRTRTLPAPDASPDKLKFAFVSCQNYEQGLFTGYEQMAKDDLDLVCHLGDYIYEYPGKDGLVRKHNGPATTKIKTLADYRQRHMQYRSDPLLHGMHAACPWFVTWDDHEVDNNYADDRQEQQRNGTPTATSAQFLVQRAAAYQAYYEMMPLREQSVPEGADMLLYRKASFGKLAEFFVLDTRQYRTDQPNGDGLRSLNDAALAPTNSLLGKKQRAWLEAGLSASPATWNVLAQQVMMGMVEIRQSDRNGNEYQGYSMDQWPGAAAERMELVKFLADQKVDNPVVLTGDIHSNWVNNLRVDDRKEDFPIVATEFVGSSISSGGNGSKEYAGLNQLLQFNPCVKFHNRERGYVRCTVTPASWNSDYVVVEDVLKPGGKVLTRASFVVEAGQPGAKAS